MRCFTSLCYVAFVVLAGCSEAPEPPRVPDIPAVTEAPDMPECTEAQLLGYVPTAEELQAHRQFELPVITYPYGIDQAAMWGVVLQAKIDESGRVMCYGLQQRWGEQAELNGQRRQVLAGLERWRYQPFQKDGQPIVAVVTELIYEQEAAKAHVPQPTVPLDQVRITLEQSTCFGTCPAFKVDVRGDGRVIYTGHAFVDVTGKHTYRIPPQQVAALVESMRTKDLWSLRESYQARITDNATTSLTLRLGDQVHRLEDYVGQMVGMPQVVSEFENEIIEVSGADGFVDLSVQAVERMKAEGFDFRSQAGADVLAFAIKNERRRDDQALLRLIEWGAPIVGGRSAQAWSGPARPVLEEALANRSTVLIDPLIQRGALQTKGVPDQAKIDGAFRAAVAGGWLDVVEKIWTIKGDKPHPSLVFKDVARDDPAVKKSAPVTLLLARPREGATDWEGAAVARWLAAQGCDLKARDANGDTLLHIAADGDDVDLVRYLLSQGLDASTLGQYSLPALGSARNEDVAMLLLEAGTDLSKLTDSGKEFRKYAEYNHWARVIAWLDAHPNK